MYPPNGYTEDALVEQPAIALLTELGWETVNACHEFDHGPSPLGRETPAEVVLKTRLREGVPLMLISGEVDVSELDIAVPEEAAGASIAKADTAHMR